MKTLLAILLLAASAMAQSRGEPFSLIRIECKPSLPGVDGLSIQAHRMARVGVDVVGVNAVTGASQTCLLEGHGTFEGIEVLDKAISRVAAAASRDSQTLSPSTTMIGVYRGGLSYRPDEAIKLL